MDIQNSILDLTYIKNIKKNVYLVEWSFKAFLELFSNFTNKHKRVIKYGRKKANIEVLFLVS